jgi:hypothetical protein
MDVDQKGFYKASRMIQTVEAQPKGFVFGLGGRIRQSSSKIDVGLVRLARRFVNRLIEPVRCGKLLPVSLSRYTSVLFPCGPRRGIFAVLSPENPLKTRLEPGLLTSFPNPAVSITLSLHRDVTSIFRGYPRILLRGSKTNAFGHSVAHS